LVLPQEGAQEGHEMYELANLSLALQMAEQKKYQQAIKYLNDSKKWPENLGSGSPYDPDNRLQDFLIAWCKSKMGTGQDTNSVNDQLVASSVNTTNWSIPKSPLYNYISVLALNKKEKSQELNKLITQWKTEQDSLHNWSLSAGSASPEFRWVMAKYNRETDKAELLEKQLMTPPGVNRVKLFFRALKVTGKEK
jgi:hypothetical protein